MQQGASNLDPGGGDTDLFLAIAESSMEGDGWNLYNSFFYRYTDPGSDGIRADDFGFVVQGGAWVAKHVEVYSRLLHDKFELAYPISPPLKALLNDVLSDSRWDMTYLGMQVLIEGLALAAFHLIRDQAKNGLAAQVNAYVMQDEARHVAFGRLALSDYYPQLTDKERDEREEFTVEACYLMRDRFMAREVWERLGFPVDECVAYMDESAVMRDFRSALFTRIVPTVKAIGLWGPRIRKAYEDMGIIGFADADIEALSREDEQIAESFDRDRPGQA